MAHDKGTTCTLCADPEGGGGGKGSRHLLWRIMAFRWRADGGPFRILVHPSLPVKYDHESNKKKISIFLDRPPDKSFCARACT